MTSPATPLPSLRTRMIGAIQWVVLASGLGHVLRLISNLVLTRLLVPEIFGLMSIATTVGVIVSMLSDIGLRQAVVRSARGDETAEDEEDVDTQKAVAADRLGRAARVRMLPATAAEARQPSKPGMRREVFSDAMSQIRVRRLRGARRPQRHACVR